MKTLHGKHQNTFNRIEKSIKLTKNHFVGLPMPYEWQTRLKYFEFKLETAKYNMMCCKSNNERLKCDGCICGK